MGTLKYVMPSMLCYLLLACGGNMLIAASIETQWGGLTHTVAIKLEYYAKLHEGQLPSTLDELYTGFDEALLENQLHSPLSSKLAYFNERKPRLEISGEEILAVTTFPINEDRRLEVGRYLVCRGQTGNIESKWESEKLIQVAVSKANLFLPSAQTYFEKPIEPLYAEYSLRLIEDAVKHGVPMEQAAKAVKKHVDDVSNRRAKAASTWAEVIAAATPVPRSVVTIPTPTTPVQTSTPVASLAPTAPVTQPPAPVSERKSQAWLWVMGTLVLIVVVAMLLKRRAE